MWYVDVNEATDAVVLMRRDGTGEDRVMMRLEDEDEPWATASRYAWRLNARAAAGGIGYSWATM